MIRLLLLGTLLLAACDSGSGADLAPGTFTLRVDGADAVTRSGAFFGDYVSDDNGPASAILLGTDPIATALSLAESVAGFVRAGEPLTPGDYPIATVDLSTGPVADELSGFYLDPAAYVTGETPLRSGFYFSRGGRLTIESVDDQSIQGSYSMTVFELDADLEPSGAEIRIVGQFHAVPSDGFGQDGALLGLAPPSSFALPF